jgi:putative transposase
MALTESAVSELLEAFRAGQGVDLIRESVRMVLQELIEAEAAEEPGQGGQNARSGQVGRAGPSCRRSTMTSCRSVNVSAMSVLLRRQSSASQDSIRVMVR